MIHDTPYDDLANCRTTSSKLQKEKRDKDYKPLWSYKKIE